MGGGGDINHLIQPHLVHFVSCVCSAAPALNGIWIHRACPDSRVVWCIATDTARHGATCQLSLLHRAYTIQCILLQGVGGRGDINQLIQLDMVHFVS